MSGGEKILKFPAATRKDIKAARKPCDEPVAYVEFAVASNFSFLRGASHAEQLIMQAEHLGLTGIGLCDRNTVAGVVRAHLAKRENKLGLRYHPGARLIFADGTPDILAYPRDRFGWGRLCRLLTRGNLRAEKGECILYLDDLLDHIESLELIVMPECTRDAPPKFLHRTRKSFSDTPPPPRKWKEERGLLPLLHEAAPGRVRLAAAMLYRGDDRARLAVRAQLAREAGVPLIAVNDVLYHHFEQRPLQDVLTCIRQHVTIDAAGRRLTVNAERHLKTGAEMARLFRDAPEAIIETLKLDATLSFSLDELQYEEYPDELVAGFATPQEALEQLTWTGARQRYPEGITDDVRSMLLKEFALIAERKYAPYFLTVYDIVRYARSQDILCQGRGSAANSTVCYCLGITSIDPVREGLLFERFISTERHEPPDIDVDFEHERREEVIQYVYDRYKRDHAGIAATVISYRGRSAVREVGKVFGLSEDTIGMLTSSIWGMGGGVPREEDIKRAGIDLSDSRMKNMRARVNELRSFPRHLSQHVGGIVLTRSRLDEVVPIMNGGMDARTHVEWDKDDLDALNLLKVDVLGLGMLTCLRKAFELGQKHYDLAFRAARQEGTEAMIGYDLATIQQGDEAVYRMLCRADSIGVFQVESRAQMSMLPRLRPEKFYDLVIEVAIVRPGPIQGDMVHPYLRRRQGIDPINYPSKELEAVLGKTLGVPLFQEQAMKIAIVAAGFTPGEADRLRRAMATFKRTGTIGTFRHKFIEGMAAKGYQRDFAERCFSQIEGFGEYGFPESHAASFALLVYASAWMKCHYPDVFAAALLNAQPMGFYASAQIVRDLREHGVEVRAADINFSDWDSTLEEGPRAAERLCPMHREMRNDIHTKCALRLGLREIKGFSEDDAERIMKHRAGGYESVRDLWLRAGLAISSLERLADADTFGSLGLSRRQALWIVKALGRSGDQDSLPLLGGRSLPPAGEIAGANKEHSEPAVSLPAMPLGEEVVNDYRFTRLSLRAHPASFLRGDLVRRRIIENAKLRTLASGVFVRVSGLVTIRQRPGSANGVIFMTIEDETGVANVIVWPKVFERFRPIVLGARYVMASGWMQEEKSVIHVVADQLDDLTPLLARLTDDLPPVEALARADAVKRPHAEDRPRPRLPGRIPGIASSVSDAADLAADLDVTAPGSAHAPTRRGKPA
jgi:error-prone DNA polymerase